jgi:hypothetical protein
MRRFYLGRSRVVKGYYEGDPVSPPTVPPTVPPTPPANTFTQDQVNAFLAKEKKGWQSQQQQLATQLEQYRTSEGVTKERAAELENQIEELKKQYMTKDELAAEASKKEKDAYTKQVTTLTSERDQWQGTFTKLLVTSQLRSAAAETEAYNTDQMVTLLGGQTKVVPVLKDGKQTGEFEVKVLFPTTSKDGEQVVLELTPLDAMKKMKDTPEKYGNLFKSGVQGGLGGNNGGPTGGPTTLVDATKSPEEYRKNREKLLGKNITTLGATMSRRKNRGYYSNDIAALIPSFWANESLAILEENMVMGNLVHKDFSPIVASLGDTVKTRRPGELTAIGSGTTMT